MTTSRIKETGNPSIQHGLFDYVQSPVYALYPDHENSGDSVSYYNHIGENTPNFHERRKKGELLPYTSWRQAELIGWSTGSLSKGRNGGRLDSVGNAPLCSNGQDLFLFDTEQCTGYAIENNLLARAQMYTDQAAANMYSSGWDVLTFLAELNKTVLMFRDFLKKIVAESKRVSPKSIHDMWLEGNYGWRMLVFDMFDINDALVDLTEERERSKQRNGFGWAETKEWTLTRAHPQFDLIHHLKDEWKVSLRGSLISDFTPPTFSFNPIRTGWELVKFSFVFDWVMNIGTWIEQLSFLALSRPYVASKGFDLTCTRTVKSTDVLCHEGGGDGYGTWWVEYEFDGVMVGRLTERAPTSVSLLPSPVQKPLNAFQIADLFALALTGLRRR